jgi:hypothetical protein
MSLRVRPVIASAVIAAAAGVGHAQHAGIVLFGEANGAAASAPKEHRHVHGVTAPYYNEDSFVTTDVRFWYAYHDFPRFGALGGGQGQVAAVQLRLALTSQLQLVAYKDGIVFLDTPLIEEDGWNDIGAGLKFNFWQDFENQFHAAVGVGYEFPWGDADVLQNDANARFWLSADKGFDRFHLGATLNFLIETGDDDALGNSDRFMWNLRADYYACEWFSPVLNFNGYHALDDEDEVVPFSGIDLANLGGGDDVVTIGIGGEFRPIPDSPNLGIRAAYETPLTPGDDLFGFRWTFSLVWSF